MDKNFKIDSSYPESLKKTIKMYLEGLEKKKTGKYFEYDLDFCELQTEINLCENAQLITEKETDYLRKELLGYEDLKFDWFLLHINWLLLLRRRIILII